MTGLKNCAVIVFSFLFSVAVRSQVVIPACTGYAVPVEQMDKDDESTLFSPQEGVHQWSDVKQTIQYYFYIKNPGKLALTFLIKNKMAGNQLQVLVGEKKFTVNVPAGNTFKKLYVGEMEIKHPGFYSISISARKKTGRTIAAIQSIELSGAAAKELHYNPSPRRNAASVHLRYPITDTTKAVLFYNEVNVPKGADPVHSYYMACGFERGYFGVQVNSPTERRVIFSVWDAGGETTDRNKVSEENKVQLIGKGEQVFADGFGNEGTGGHSHWVYNWKAGETYQFAVTALPDSATRTTIYAGYFFIPEVRKWKLIAAFKAPREGKYLKGLYSFIENFWGVNGQLQRKAFFSNQWIRNQVGEWKELTRAIFSYDVTAKAGDRIDYGGGVEDNKFYLWNGGFQKANTAIGDPYFRSGHGVHPEIDWLKNADSLSQAQKDKQLIFNAIASGGLDTTGSREGVYYKVLAEGSGNNVRVSDTIVAHYKGSLLNGEIFDQTKAEPATFPLARLIKGWQIGLPLCREGGKIRLIIPSALAYSIRTRSMKIPPNSVLLFDIEVVGIKR